MLQRLAKISSWQKCRSLHTLPLTVNKLLDLGNDPKENIELFGWVQSVRKQKKRTFLVITDGSNSGSVQAVATAEEVDIPQK